MTRLGRRLQTYFGPFVRALLVTIGISPFLPWLLRDVPGLGYIGQAIDAWFSFQCHRDPARSLPWLGGSLPVCSRCFGVYTGLGLGALVVRPRLKVWPLRLWVLGAALLMLADVASEGLRMRPGSTVLRMATGMLLAYPVGAALVCAARSAGKPTG
jgi:uncharacterized membrane protein